MVKVIRNILIIFRLIKKYWIKREKEHHHSVYSYAKYFA